MTGIEMVRAKVTVTVDQDLIAWVDKLIKDKKFRNRSHAVEYALHDLRKQHDKTIVERS